MTREREQYLFLGETGPSSAITIFDVRWNPGLLSKALWISSVWGEHELVRPFLPLHLPPKRGRTEEFEKHFCIASAIRREVRQLKDFPLGVPIAEFERFQQRLYKAGDLKLRLLHSTEEVLDKMSAGQLYGQKYEKESLRQIYMEYEPYARPRRYLLLGNDGKNCLVDPWGTVMPLDYGLPDQSALRDRHDIIGVIPLKRRSDGLIISTPDPDPTESVVLSALKKVKDIAPRLLNLPPEDIPPEKLPEAARVMIEESDKISKSERSGWKGDRNAAYIIIWIPPIREDSPQSA